MFSRQELGYAQLFKVRCRWATRLAFCSQLTLLLTSLLSSIGCRWPGNDGPVPRSLLQCRQLSQQGLVAMERGDLQNADALLAKAVATCPIDTEARRRYAEALYKQGHRREALAQLTKAIEQSPDDHAAWVRRAEIELALNNLTAAHDSAQRALQLNPRSASAWLIEGCYARQNGDLRGALAHYHRALSYEPNQRELLLELAQTYQQVGEPQRALANLQTLVDSYPPGEEPQQIMYYQGIALLALQRNNEAVDVLSNARDRAPPTPELLYQLAEAQLRIGHAAQAREVIGQALSIEPGHLASRSLLQKLDVAELPQPLRR